MSGGAEETFEGCGEVVGAGDTCLEASLELDELGYAVVHLFHSLVLGETEAPLVGDVVDAALGLSVLAAGSAHLEIVLGRDLLEFGLVGSELRHLDVHGCAHRRAQVRRAESKKAEAVVVRERHPLLDLVHGGHQTTVYLVVTCQKSVDVSSS